MSKTNVIKKSLTLLLAFSMTLCIFASFGNAKVSAATDRVSMYYANPYFVKYGMTTQEIYVQTKDNTSNQQVIIHYNYMDGKDWMDQEAECVTTLSDGSKIWMARIISYNLKYAIKYVADGEVFWDNNNGNDYTREKIGTAPITVVSQFPQGNYSYNVSVLLQNYAYEKNVQLRYTEDNWNSYTDVPLHYDEANDSTTEWWSVDINLDSSKTSDFEYCVYYQVNGQTYWANNFGKNYDIYDCIHH